MPLFLSGQKPGKEKRNGTEFVLETEFGVLEMENVVMKKEIARREAAESADKAEKTAADKSVTGKERIRRELAANGREKIRSDTEQNKKMQGIQEGTGYKAEPVTQDEAEASGREDAGAEDETDMLSADERFPKTEAEQKERPESDKPQKSRDEAVRLEEWKEELLELEARLLQENIRTEELRREAEEMRARLEQERKQFTEYVKTKESSLETDRKRLEQENRFFDQKMKILQGGFEQLEEDRRRFQKEKDKFDACKEVYTETQDVFMRYEMTEMLFRGVNSFLALKKRYKDLIKMFHPDNVAGDQEMVQLINREYEELKKAYEVGLQA